MEERLIDFDELKGLFKRTFWIVIVITTITTALSIYKVSKLQPTYVASSKIFIGKGSEMYQYYSEKELESYTRFLTIFKEIASIDGFLDTALKDNNINLPSTLVAARLNFSGSENTPLFTISYSSGIETDITKILDVVSAELVSKIAEIMPETSPTVLSKATVSTIYPDKRRLPMIAFIAGIVISIGLILIIDYLDDKVRGKKELERMLPIPVLGEIPTHEKSFVKEAKHVRSKTTTKVSVGGSV